MPLKDPDAQRAYQAKYKREVARPAAKARRSLHQELGIATFVHLQAILHSPGGKYSRGIKGEQVNSHWYRMPITLAKVWA